MRISRLICFFIALHMTVFLMAQSGDEYLNWSAKEVKRVGTAMTKKDSVSGASFRVMNTNQATAYQYRATWLTPSVIRATARLEQVRQRLTNDETKKIVEEAENAGPAIFLIELDAIEGSGVIPSDWQAFLQPEKLPVGSDGCMKGQNTPELWKVKGLAGVYEKDYKYERFWVVFPLTQKDGMPLFSPGTKNAELIVRINGKEGKTSFPIPMKSIR